VEELVELVMTMEQAQQVLVEQVVVLVDI